MPEPRTPDMTDQIEAFMVPDIRILCTFGPDRTLVLLYAGDKAGEWNRWYRTAIPEAARLYREYLDDMR